MSKPKIAVIIGATRATRFGDKPAEWIANIAKARGDFDVEIVAFENRRREVENAAQLAGFETMLGVIRHPGLQKAGGGEMRFAAAVEEGFIHASHFGDVKMGGNRRSVRQREREWQIGMGFEQGFEFRGGHKISSSPRIPTTGSCS